MIQLEDILFLNALSNEEYNNTLNELSKWRDVYTKAGEGPKTEKNRITRAKIGQAAAKPQPPDPLASKEKFLKAGRKETPAHLKALGKHAEVPMSKKSLGGERIPFKPFTSHFPSNSLSGELERRQTIDYRNKVHKIGKNPLPANPRRRKDSKNTLTQKD